MVLQVRATFPETLIREPILFNLVQNFCLITNILGADIQTVDGHGVGWVRFSMSGKERDIHDGVAWLAHEGIIVEQLSFDKEDLED